MYHPDIAPEVVLLLRVDGGQFLGIFHRPAGTDIQVHRIVVVSHCETQGLTHRSAAHGREALLVQTVVQLRRLVDVHRSVAVSRISLAEGAQLYLTFLGIGVYIAVQQGVITHHKIHGTKHHTLGAALAGSQIELAFPVGRELPNIPLVAQEHGLILSHPLGLGNAHKGTGVIVFGVIEGHA